jgi:hypothetical protein
MQEAARFRDHLYFASDETAAEALGVSRMTIQRAKRELEEVGLITRTEHVRFRKTVVYKLPVTQRSCRAGRTSRTAPCGRSSGRASAPAAGRGRRRRLMERHPDVIRTQGIKRADGSVTPANAGDALAHVIDWFRERGMPLTRQAKGMLARQAKDLLEDGFDYELVVASAILSVRRCTPQHMHFIASDLAAARAGQWISTRDAYRKSIEDSVELARDRVNRLVEENS